MSPPTMPPPATAMARLQVTLAGNLVESYPRKQHTMRQTLAAKASAPPAIAVTAQGV